MVKTITITDDVYEELVKMKGNRSFSELLREMIKNKKGNLDILLKLGEVVDADELEKISKEIDKEFEKWREHLIQM